MYTHIVRGSFAALCAAWRTFQLKRANKQREWLELSTTPAAAVREKESKKDGGQKGEARKGDARGRQEREGEGEEGEGERCQNPGRKRRRMSDTRWLVRLLFSSDGTDQRSSSLSNNDKSHCSKLLQFLNRLYINLQSLAIFLPQLDRKKTDSIGRIKKTNGIDSLFFFFE